VQQYSIEKHKWLILKQQNRQYMRDVPQKDSQNREIVYDFSIERRGQTLATF
jgi:hypothetical protein